MDLNQIFCRYFVDFEDEVIRLSRSSGQRSRYKFDQDATENSLS